MAWASIAISPRGSACLLASARRSRICRSGQAGRINRRWSTKAGLVARRLGASGVVGQQQGEDRARCVAPQQDLFARRSETAGRIEAVQGRHQAGLRPQHRHVLHEDDGAGAGRAL